MDDKQPFSFPFSVNGPLTLVFSRGSWRKFLLAALFSVLLGLVLLMGKKTPPFTEEKKTEKPVLSAASFTPETDEETFLADQLASILSRVAGAGAVEVRLTFAWSTVREWEENRRQTRRTSEERSKDGTVQITGEESVETTLALVRKADGSEAPVEKSTSRATVAGAIVVAEGAADPVVREELARATATFLQIGLHRVVVLPRRGGGR